MISLVTEKAHYDDNRKIIAISAKIKSDNPEQEYLVSIVNSAIHDTTLLKDEGSMGINITLDPKRPNVADLIIKLHRGTFARADVANFFDALQRAIDDTKLF